MIKQRSHILSRSANGSRRDLHATLLVTATACAIPCTAASPPDDPPPRESLHFTLETRPAPVNPVLTFDPASLSVLNFDPDTVIDDQPRPGELYPPLDIMNELMLVGSEPSEDAPPGAFDPEAIEIFSLRFEDGPGENSLLSSAGANAGISRWEVLPALYLRSGQVLDEGYESLDYADLYAELGVDLTSNTGLWLRYERLRQALGSSREGEQVDADALFLQFELRF